jgi:uncharacterized protein
VVDNTSTLTQTEINSLITKLIDFEKQTSNQIVVYLIPTLGSESLEDISIRIAIENKIGKKDKNNGILLLIVKNDRKIRIEVGYGLEGALPDALCRTIIDKEIIPLFKKGNYNEGINKGIDAIISATKDEYQAEKNNSDKNPKWTFGLPIFVIILFAVIFILIIISIIRSIFGFGNRTYTGSGGTGGGGFFFFGGGGGSDNFSSGSSSDSSSFGDLSGGGGDFGGGGASGDW